MTSTQLSIGPAAVHALGYVANGLIRIPALATNLTAATMTGELAVRTLGSIWTSLVGKPDPNGYLGAFVDHARKIRPFGQLNPRGGYLVATPELVKEAALMVGISLVSNAVAQVLCGPAPRIYNDVLAFMGPFTIDNALATDRIKNIINSYQKMI